MDDPGRGGSVWSRVGWVAWGLSVAAVLVADVAGLVSQGVLAAIAKALAMAVVLPWVLRTRSRLVGLGWALGALVMADDVGAENGAWPELTATSPGSVWTGVRCLVGGAFVLVSPLAALPLLRVHGHVIFPPSAVRRGHGAAEPPPS